MKGLQFAAGSALAAYSTLFGTEAVMLLIALYRSTRLDVNASLEERKIASLAARTN